MLSFLGLVRPPAVAGQFYSNKPEILRQDITKYMAQVSPTLFGYDIAALVVPHAGYGYSGLTAAYAYKEVQSRSYDAVVLIAPCHREAFSGVSIMARGAYATPLGTMSIHEEICNRLIEVNDIIHHTLAGHVSQHAIEVQLPFIQFALGHLPIVPLIMADRTWSLCSTLAHIFATTTIDF